MLDSLQKNGVKRSSHSGRTLCIKIQAIQLAERIFQPQLKKQTGKLFEMMESFCCFYRCLTHMQKVSIIAQVSLDMLRI